MPEELASGIIPDSVNVPLPDLPDGAEHLKGKTLITYCAGGVRSAIAARILAEHGFGWVASLRGGIDDWRRNDRPLEHPEGADPYGRYARQMLLPGVGRDGQDRLSAATVAIVGMGGLGSPVAMYLAGAGIGALRLIDGDVVDLTNLHRQPVHDETGIGLSKVDTAADVLIAINGQVHVEAHREDIDERNAMRLLGGADLIVDATDRIPARYAINEAAVEMGIPMVHASVFRFEGRLTVFHPPDGPCYRCLHPVEPEPGTVPTCEAVGVLGPVPAVLGSMQATEVLKLLLGIGTPLVGEMLVWDALTQETNTFRIPRTPDCAVCGAT
jgi:molybdopterin/thiamine biosynthesis adenylyltransferase